MKIVRAEVRAYGGPIRPGAATSRSEWPRRDGLLLILGDELGNAGFGEASPLPGYSPDDLAGTRAILEGFDWARFGGPIKGTVGSIRERINVGLDWTGLRAGAMPAARYAAESALFDLIARRAGISVERMLGAPGGGPLPVASLVGSERAAEAAVVRGVRTLKLKVGRDLREERALAAAIRARYGKRVAIRLDANGAYTPDQMRDVAAAFGPIEPEVMEEPVHFSSWMRLPRLPFPIAADESLADPAGRAMLDGALASGAIRGVVLKPALLGGFTACLVLAESARARGALSYVTHLFDGPVALAGACALAFATRGTTSTAAGLDSHAGLDAWPAWPVTSLRGPELHPHGGKGLCVEPR